MSNTNTGGPAFPTPRYERGDMYSLGMTLRDYFAAKALPIVVGWMSTRSEILEYSQCAKSAYGIADAMLKARES